MGNTSLYDPGNETEAAVLPDDWLTRPDHPSAQDIGWTCRLKNPGVTDIGIVVELEDISTRSGFTIGLRRSAVF